MLRLCCGTQGTRTENGSLAEALEKRRYLVKKLLLNLVPLLLFAERKRASKENRSPSGRPVFRIHS